MNKLRYFPVLVLCCLILYMSFFRLGSLTLFDVDEAVFAEATKEMVQNGEWITPTYNGIARYDKPILFYWFMAASYYVFGVSEFAARLPSAVFGFVLCTAIYFFVRYVHDERSARYSLLALSLSAFFVAYSHAAVTDMALTCFIVLSLFSFYYSLRKEVFILGFYAFSALAFLTKGLIGIIFPFVIASFYLMATEGVRGTRKVLSLKGTILFCLISLPWYSIQTAVNGSEFIRQFFLKHHFMRYTGVISGHKGPVFYYVLVLLAGLFPWVAFLPAGIRRALKERREADLFALIWFATIVAFFSFSTTKLPNYVLPAVPAAVLLISSGMSDPNVRWRRYANLSLSGVSAALAVALLFYGKGYLMRIHVNDTEWISLTAAVLFALSILSAYAAANAGRRFYVLVSCVMVLLLTVLSVKALPVANRLLQGTLYRYSLYAGSVTPADGRIIAYGLNNPSIVFYSGRKVVTTRKASELLPYLTSGKTRVAIAKTKEMESLKGLGFSLLENDGTYALFERK